MLSVKKGFSQTSRSVGIPWLRSEHNLKILPFGTSECTHPGKPHWRERISTDDLLVLTSLEKTAFLTETIFPFYKTTYLNEEVNRTEPSPSVRLPWHIHPPNLYDTHLLDFYDENLCFFVVKYGAVTARQVAICQTTFSHKTTGRG
jgi:hypothetical protein